MRISIFFFFNDTATTEIYTLSLPRRSSDLYSSRGSGERSRPPLSLTIRQAKAPWRSREPRSEEHTSELQSRLHLVCRLLLEKKKTQRYTHLSRTRAHAS